MATPYSTVAECRARVAKAKKITDISNADILLAIIDADKKVKEDLGNIYDMTAVDAAATTPDPVNELSRYQTNELVLVTLFGGNRALGVYQSDIDYWANKYETKLAAIYSGVVALGPLGLATGTFSNKPKADVLPALGHGKYAGYIDADSLEGIRVEDIDE